MTCPTSKNYEPRPRRGRAGDRRGFTLLELLLVVGVMALALGLGLPRFGTVRSSYLAAEEAHAVVGFVRAARLDAVVNRSTVGVATAPDHENVLEQRRLPVRAWTTGEDAQPVAEAACPQGVWDAAVVRRAEVTGAIRVESDGQGILFFANGSSTGGEITLHAADGRLQHRFLIDPRTGEIVAQRKVDP